MKGVHTHTHIRRPGSFQVSEGGHLPAEIQAEGNNIDSLASWLENRNSFRAKHYLLFPLFFILNAFYLTAQCTVDQSCLVPGASYFMVIF